MNNRTSKLTALFLLMIGFHVQQNVFAVEIESSSPKQLKGFALVTITEENNDELSSHRQPSLEIRKKNTRNRANSYSLSGSLISDGIPKSEKESDAYLPDNEAEEVIVSTPLPPGLHLVELPPGVYEIYNWSLVNHDGQYAKHYGARSDFSYPFTVNTGEITYIGDFHFAFYSDHRYGHPYRIDKVLKNNIERDSALVKIFKSDLVGKIVESEEMFSFMHPKPSGKTRLSDI
ncbi:MAG: hypothetical protein OEZ58_20080 [Gammaproteobacteria bacterium]|nr:hypothetical protein [Gammaproteobacteria bacterium]MDH5731290.1 hypothetical protein [Gammaproteobacteria bacterium]